MAILEDGLVALDEFGLRDVLIPFLLVFAITFAVLQKSRIFERKAVNVTIALVIGLVVVIPHLTGDFGDQDPVEIINSSLPAIMVFIVAVIMFYILSGAFGTTMPSGLSGSTSVAVAIFAIGVVGYIFMNAAGYLNDLPDWLSFLNDSDTQAVLVLVLVFGIMLWYISRSPSKPGGSRGDAMKKFFNGFYGNGNHNISNENRSGNNVTEETD